MLDHLVRTYPDARFTIACGPAVTTLFDRVPNRERTLVVVKHKNDSHWFKLWRQVAFTFWDLVVDFRGSAIAYLVPTRRRAVLRRTPGRKYEQYAAMLGIDPPPLPTVWTAPADQARAAALLPNRPVIGFGATANWGPKVWPADRFAALFARLAQGPLPGATAAIFAGPGAAERQMAQPLLDALPSAVDLCGQLTLPEAAACIQRCDLYVGNDSGLMHLAAATGTPTIGLCGTTIDRAEEMSPAGRRAAWVLADGPSMEALSVDAAYAACLAMLTPCSPAVPAYVAGSTVASAPP